MPDDEVPQEDYIEQHQTMPGDLDEEAEQETEADAEPTFEKNSQRAPRLDPAESELVREVNPADLQEQLEVVEIDDEER